MKTNSRKHLTRRHTAFGNLKSKIANPESKISSPRPSPRRLFLEPLENRQLLAGEVFPNDPEFTLQWELHNTGQNGLADADLDAPAAWSVTTGSMTTVLAEIDDGVDYTHPDLYLNIWLNEAEIPAGIAANLTDTDSDGVFTFRDLNAPANASYVTNLNGNAYIDGGDLLADPSWENGVDEDGNGYTDDLVGWDFEDNDNNPMPIVSGAHGTTMSLRIGAIANNGIAGVGVNWFISIMPVRFWNRANPVDFTKMAAGLDYAVAADAPLSALYGGNFEFSQVIYDSIDRARLSDHLVIAPSGNDSANNDVTPRYPASFNLDNIISATSVNQNNTMDAIWNYGATSVDLAAPTNAGGGTSGGALFTAGVAALVKTVHPDWTYSQIKDRILSTVDPLPSLAGKTVTGGRLNAASAVGVGISISDATISEVGGYSTFVSSGSGGLQEPVGMTIGPDGNLYVSSAANSRVLRYDGQTGALLSTFVPSGSGGLNRGYGVAFAPNGNLLVASSNTDQVLRYNGSTGAFLGVFVPASAGLQLPGMLLFGPDGNLYVSDFDADSVVRFNGSTGAFIDTFVAPGSGGLDSPRDMAFGPDGNLYVAGRSSGNVLRYDGDTGAFIDEFIPRGTAGLDDPWAVNFGPDSYLYVTRVNAAKVLRFDAMTGAFVGELLGTARSPTSILFADNGSLLTTNRTTNEVVRYSAGLSVTLSHATSETLTVDYSTSAGSAASGVDYAAQSGTLTFLPGQTSRMVLLQPLDDLEFESNEALTISLANPSANGVIADGSALVTIADDDASRTVSIGDAFAIEGDSTAHFRGNYLEGNYGDFLQITFHQGIAYVGTGSNTIRRYDALTAQFIDTFVPAGTIDAVRDIRFQGDYMYVVSENTDEVLRYNADTGAFAGVFVAAGTGVDNPHGMTFGPDANNDGIPEVYVSGRISGNIGRFDGATGLPLGTYVATGSGGLGGPEGITFDPTGATLLVSNAAGSNILKYNAQTGAFLGVAASTGLLRPLDVKFGPDGLMYVASADNDRIVRFHANGTYFDDYVPAGVAGMDNPYRVHFGPDGNLYVTNIPSKNVLRFGTESEAVLTVSLSSASSLPLTVDFQTTNGTAIAGNDYAIAVSTVTFGPGVTSQTVRIPILNDFVQEPNETFFVNLSNAAGASFADDQATVTILDNETKFYVVDDASTNRTFEYGTSGLAGENYTLTSGNTAPRGAASNVAGDKVWVVDSNRNVYVYNPSGTLLGAWSVGGFNASAQFEGIATNGTDIWIVDNKTDKVYRFTGAATRLTGSQSAASSFSLNSGNKDATDLVTDGTSIWVLNNSATDKVFKYTVGGSLLGSWTISGGGGSPTGITIDPASVSNIWIADSSSDRVYQFNSAASRTSGSASPNSSFALASGNTNPQGIADPPVIGGVEIGGHSPPYDPFDAAILSVIEELDELFGGLRKRK